MTKGEMKQEEDTEIMDFYLEQYQECRIWREIMKGGEREP